MSRRSPTGRCLTCMRACACAPVGACCMRHQLGFVCALLTRLHLFSLAWDGVHACAQFGGCLCASHCWPSHVRPFASSSYALRFRSSVAVGIA
eukprot:1663543-Alexandrium_andersonii.AAC.1